MIEEKTAIADTLASLPAATLASLLAQVARVCPRCGSRMFVRTSKRTKAGDRLAHLRCRCGASKKQKL